MSLNLLNHLQLDLWTSQQQKLCSRGRIYVFSHLWNYLIWPHLPALQCTLHRLNDFPSAPGVDITSATSAPPSLSISQGQWHSPVEPSPQLPWQLFSQWAEYCSLSQWWSNKCYNYVNSVQPKCFCRLNIASWKALGPALSAPKLCSEQSILHCCFTSRLWFFPLFTLSLFHIWWFEWGDW